MSNILIFEQNLEMSKKEWVDDKHKALVTGVVKASAKSKILIYDIWKKQLEAFRKQMDYIAATVCILHISSSDQT